MRRTPDTPAYSDTSAPGAPAGLAGRLALLPDGHPSAPREKPDQRAEIRPLTDAEHAEHVADVQYRLAGAERAGLDTSVRHTTDGRGQNWSDDRALIHDELVGALLAQSAGVPRDGKAVIAGGLPGAGKSTVLAGQAGLDLRQYLVVNPDIVKTEMARRGLIPPVDGLSPMEACGLVHEESSHVARRLARRAQSGKVNLIWDVTMSSPEATAARVDALRAAGYDRVDAIFVDVPVPVSLHRADARHREGHEEFRAGAGLGGRFTPAETIRSRADSAWGSINRAGFEAVKDRFTSWSRYDNSADGRPATLVAGSGGPGSPERRTRR